MIPHWFPINLGGGREGKHVGSEILRARCGKERGASICCSPLRHSQRGETPWRKALSLHLPRIRFFPLPCPIFSRENAIYAVRFGVVKLSSMRSVDGLGLFSPYRARCASSAFLSFRRVGPVSHPFLNGRCCGRKCEARGGERRLLPGYIGDK